jgi:hypothetical protein
MTWAGNFVEFVKRLLNLEERVGKNTQELKELRQDLKTLSDFVGRVAYRGWS